MPGCVYGGSAEDRLTNGTQAYTFRNLDYSATYCVQMLARNWNDGDPQDGLVSDNWSSFACATVSIPSLGATTRAKPAVPPTPSLSSEMSPRGRNEVLSWSGCMKSGDLCMLYGDRILVQKAVSGSWTTLEDTADLRGPMSFVDRNAGDGTLQYRLCAVNDAGTTCGGIAHTPYTIKAKTNRIEEPIH